VKEMESDRDKFKEIPECSKKIFERERKEVRLRNAEKF